MEFLLNDLSMHGQFTDVQSFRAAIARIMVIRQSIARHGYMFFCHSSLVNSQVTAELVMKQAVQHLTEGQRRSLMAWMTRLGPHWEDIRVHEQDDYLAVGNEVVTDCSLGEAAVCNSRGLQRDVVSLRPSRWNTTPIAVTWTLDDGTSHQIDVQNHWDLASVEEVLAANPRPICSWKELAERATAQFENLVISDDAFSELEGQPFASGAADRILIRLNVLDRLFACLDSDRNLSDDGLVIHREHFTGDKAWFTDSSDDEKVDFENEMTFRHPDRDDEWLFCTWHGKVKTPQLRIHFTWPVPKDAPLYVVYVGPKITKR